MVIGIIMILMGIVTTAASSSVKSSRLQRANALCTVVQAALETYREQDERGRFPGQESWDTRRANQEGVNNNNEADIYVLNGTEVRACVRALVDKARDGNPMMDVSGLFVSRSDGEGSGSRATGMDFMSAIRGTKRSKVKMKVPEMYFGYPDPETGSFRRFKMTYSIPTGQLTVSKQ